MAEPLWTATELRELYSAAAISGDLPETAGGVSIDTRTLQPGDIFFAIKGDRTNGHDYIEQAFEAGAAIAIVEQGLSGVPQRPLIRVDDTLEAMCALGRAARARSRAQIVAVTGSVGKTSTKEMLRLLLGRIGNVHASDKSYNNHWGVPLSLARLPRDADYAVFEIGMNHAGEIVPLTQLVRPHAAIVTTVGPVHIEFFDSVEAIAEAKAEIFQGVEPGGASILNRDNEHFARLAERAGEAGIGRIVSFGRESRADAALTAFEAQPDGSRVEADYLGESVTYQVGARGEHLAVNSLAALAAVKILGGNIHEAAPALAEFGAPAGRGALTVHAIEGGTFSLIDEAYNANPASMSAAFAVLGSLPREEASRRVAVLGDMRELGALSEALHEGLAAGVSAAGIDTVYCCGPHMAALFAALPLARRGAWAENAEDLKDTVLAEIRAGDAVMIKGSLGSRMGPIVEAIKQTFPHCESAAKPAAA
jgi:UDP-N-acetylmuramoyl-tripeptide--D-alanyl-D-alanine ligase